MTAWTGTKWSTTRMGRPKSTRMKWVYQTLTPKKQGVAFIQTVQDNSEAFNKKKPTASKNAHKSNGMIGHIFEREFKSMVRNNMIQNCPITASDVTNSQNMFGPKLTGTRGKTVQ